MVLGKQELGGVCQTRVELRQLLVQQPLLIELVLDPQRHRCAKRCKATRHEREIGFDQPVEFEKRLVVEHDVVDVPTTVTGFRQAVADGMRRKVAVVLLSGEALLLRGGDDVAVVDERGGTVVIKSRDAENFHSALTSFNAAAIASTCPAWAQAV